MRRLEKVIARMLEEVPPGIPREDELPPAEDEFADALRRLRKSVAVASSEMLSFWRREVQRLLNDCIPRDDGYLGGISSDR